MVVLVYGLALLWWLFFKSTSLNLYGFWPHGVGSFLELSNLPPRSSGIGRSALILCIPIIITIITQNKTEKIFFILYYFFTLLILLTQSRIVILFLVIATPLIFLHFIKKKTHI